MFRISCVILLLVLLSSGVNVPDAAGQVRIKDITTVQGLADRIVTGYGLVTGLEGTGDGTGARFTIQSVANLLRNMGIVVEVNRIRMRNTAAVMVTATLRPFTRRGTKFDVIASSLGDASSLEGGSLIQTPLFNTEGVLHAYAQGSISIGGRQLDGAGGSAQQNFPLVGKVINGATSELDLPLSFIMDGSLHFLLRQPDFTSAHRIMSVINKKYGDQISKAQDASTISVVIPQHYLEDNQVVSFISEVEQLRVMPDELARVVINERTGTVIVGRAVHIFPVAISHGELSINIRADAGGGATEEGRMIMLEEEQSGNVGDLAQALNAIGVSPKDIIAIFQSLKEAGALKAELVVM